MKGTAILRFGSVVILALGIAVGAHAAELAQPVRVVDGDTLRVGSVTVRLWGIDAPEWNETGGAAATTFLRGLVWARTVVCHPVSKQSDPYGRVVAQCFVGSVDLAGALVEAGYAHDWPAFSKGYYAR